MSSGPAIQRRDPERNPSGLEEEERSDVAAPETPRRPRGLPKFSYRVWGVSTDRSRDGQGMAITGSMKRNLPTSP